MNNNDIIVLDGEVKALDINFRKFLYFGFKRFFDIFLSLIGSIFLVPFIILVKIIYMTSGDFHSIFFTHQRIGKGGKTFKMYKFRTMVPNAEEVLQELLKDKKIRKEWQENHKLDNDPRITKIGGILRRTSLDELPQILNILKGDMSIIGPRPLVQEEVDDYGKNKDKLLSIRPGLTGWWACNGRSCITTKQRRELELYYVDNCSLVLDIKVIFKTVIAVLKKEGAK